MLELTQANFSQTIKDNAMVVVDFWAPWCGPCRMFGPIFEKTAEQFGDVTFAKLNTEDNQELAGALDVMSIPTLMVFRDGYLIFRQAGALNQTQLTQLVSQLKELDMTELVKEAEAAQAGRGSGGDPTNA